MSYVVRSGASQRSRSRRRAALTLLLVLALMAAAFYYAAEYWKNPGRSSAAPCSTSATAGRAAGPVAGPAPGQITVNVYNATDRSGLAASTAKQVRERGFVVGTISNDPQHKSVAQPAEVRYGKNGEAAAKVVMTLVAGAAPTGDARADASVDLVLGAAFQSLAPPAPAPAPATPAPAAKATPSPGSSPC